MPNPCACQTIDINCFLVILMKMINFFFHGQINHSYRSQLHKRGRCTCSKRVLRELIYLLLCHIKAKRCILYMLADWKRHTKRATFSFRVLVHYIWRRGTGSKTINMHNSARLSADWGVWSRRGWGGWPNTESRRIILSGSFPSLAVCGNGFASISR